MPINAQFIYVARVLPAKGGTTQAEPITSLILRERDDAYAFLHHTFESAIGSRGLTEIHFPGDRQHNPIRESILNLGRNVDSALRKQTADEVACRLAKFSDKRTGNGLFVAMAGKERNKARIVFSRYREDEVLRFRSDGIEILKDTFPKHSPHYKMAVFEDSIDGRNVFWGGYAVDKQQSTAGTALYWIRDFLEAEIAVTSPQGSRLFAEGLKKVLNGKDISESEQQQIFGAIAILKNLDGIPLCPNEICSNLEESLKEKIRISVPSSVMGSSFILDAGLFYRSTGQRITTTTKGATVSAPADKYDEIVTEQILEDGNVRLSTEGPISNRGLRR